MANLVEILARELKEWPGVRAISQGAQCFLRDEANYPIEMQLELASDWSTAIVTRAEWQAAVDALKKAGVIGWWHPLANNEHNKAFPAVTSTWVQCRDLGDGYEGRKEDGSEYHVLTKYWRWEPVSKKNVEWDGVGLPPVGAVVEYLTTDRGEYWCNAAVRFIGSHWVVVGYQHPTEGSSEAGINYVLLGEDLSRRLRPIRTPEQIAEEERQAVLMEMQRAVDKGKHGPQITLQNTLMNLYDAGYRKQEQK